MVFPFAALPPEINSGFMYSGAGSGPLLAASTAWSNLAAELSTTATSWDSIIGTLTGEQWTGAGSTAAAAAAQPYIGWLTKTSAAAEQAAAQAQASAAAYEAAFAGVVPPPEIAANRSLLATLVATNFLGINSAAIAATEAQYAEMWVQDAVTLTTYEAASTAAAVLQPLTPAAPTTSPTAAATQSLAVTQAATATPAAGILGDLTGLLTGGNGSLFSGIFNALPVPVQNLLNAADGFLGTPLIFNGIQEVGVTAAWFVGNTIPTAISLGHTLAATTPAAIAGVSSVTPLTGAAAIGEGTLVNSVMGSGASAGLGGASAVGGLSVPASWSSAAPATLASSTAPLEGSGWTAATDEAGSGPVSGMMPGMATAGKGAGAFAGPRYGFKPTVMPKQVVV
jgi:PPE-repeat protein